VYNGGSYSLFYLNYRDISLYGQNGYLVENHKSAILRNKDFQLSKGIGYGKRGEIFDCHILKERFLFTKEGQAIIPVENDEALECLSYFNSIVPQYVFNTYAGQHKASGYVNLMPYPKKERNILKKNFSHVTLILEMKRKYFSWDETGLEFHHLLKEFSKSSSLKNRIIDLQKNLKIDKEAYLKLVTQNDDLWLLKTF
jgi:hypothetical protein